MARRSGPTEWQIREQPNLKMLVEDVFGVDGDAILRVSVPSRNCQPPSSLWTTSIRLPGEKGTD
jgi:hypothetical protein